MKNARGFLFVFKNIFHIFDVPIILFSMLELDANSIYVEK